MGPRSSGCSVVTTRVMTPSPVDSSGRSHWRASCWLSSRSVNDESAGGRVDVVWVTPHNGSQGGLDMARSYRDSTAARRARVPTGVGPECAVFDQASDVDLHVDEVRETRSLRPARRAALDRKRVARGKRWE